MPQKFRQRGKKKKGSSSVTGANSLALATPKTDGQEQNDQNWTQSDYVPLDAGDQGQLESEADHAESGVEHRQFEGSGHPDDIAPFGFVNPDLKSYLKDAQASLVQMVTPYQAQGADYADDDADDQSEQAETLRLAMLREMDGQELACATDGEASLSLESVIHGLDTRRLRILADRMSGSSPALASHRFGSHVLQSILQRLQEDVKNSIEKGKGRLASNGTADGDNGVLRSSEQLILDLAQEIMPEAQTLLQGTFSTHIVRAMLHVLAGIDIASSRRSKKSETFRTKSHLPHQEGSRKVETSAMQLVPPSFPVSLKALREACLPRDVTGRNEVRALLVSPSASPTFALLISLEAQARESVQSGSLADVVLEGLISDQCSSLAESEAQGGVETLLRHPSGSHTLEALLAHLPTDTADRFWRVYVQGKVTRLSCHPVANFVLMAAAKRLNQEVLKSALTEIYDAQGGKMVKENKTGVLLALLARAAALSKKSQDHDIEGLAFDATLAAFGLEASDAQSGLLLQTILALKTKEGWRKMMKRRTEKEKANEKAGIEQSVDGDADRKAKRKRDEEVHDPGSLRSDEVTIQGSILLQALVRVGHPKREKVYQSLSAVPSLKPYLVDPTASHVFLYALGSPAATFPEKRRLAMQLVPSLVDLADDKYGSRVADAVWAALDLYGRERTIKKITGKDESRLVASYYGRFFLSKRMQLSAYRKSVDKWKEMQAESKQREAVEFAVPELASEAPDMDDELDGVVRGKSDDSQEQAPDDQTGETARSRKERKKDKKKERSKVKSKQEMELDSIFADA